MRGSFRLLLTIFLTFLSLASCFEVLPFKTLPLENTVEERDREVQFPTDPLEDYPNEFEADTGLPFVSRNSINKDAELDATGSFAGLSADGNEGLRVNINPWDLVRHYIF